jgi:hypothetical protein
MSDEVQQPSVGIKESLELLEGLKLLAVEAKKVLADGKLSAADLPVILDLINNVSVLVAAVQGLGEIKAEVKDLSAEEIQQLGAKVLEIVAAVKAA